MNRENCSLDLLKLIMSFVVVAIHSGLFAEKIYPFARLAVPTFFILTGYFSFCKINNVASSKAKVSAFRSIIKRNFALYFCWTLLLFPFIYYMRGFFAMGIAKGIPQMLASIARGVSFVGSWYIYASIIALGIIFFLSKYWSNQALFLFAIPFYLIATASSELPFVYHVPLISTAIKALSLIFGELCFGYPIALLYIVIGKIIADSKTKEYGAMVYLGGFLVCLIGLQFEFNYVEKWITAFYNRDCYFMLAPTSYFLIKLVLKMPLNLESPRILRKISVIIYCTHGVVLAIADKCLKLANCPDPTHILQYTLTILCCCILSICITKLAKKPKLAFRHYFY